MTTLTTALTQAAVWGSGFLVGAVVASGRRRHRGNGNCEPMPPAPPYSSAAIAWRAAEAQPTFAIGELVMPQRRSTPQRIYRGAMWREKGSDAWHPLGEPIDFTEIARQQLNRTTPPLKPQFPPPRKIREDFL